MRHLSALSVEADFGTAPPDLSGVPGVAVTGTAGNRVLCQVTGPIRPLLAALAGSDVRHLTAAREPSLEELFLAHYGADTTAIAEAPDAA